MIAPAGVSTAFPFEEKTPREKRTLPINGKQVEYNDQLFWAGFATLPSLPASAAPIGVIDGLPAGVQIVGPYLEDKTTLAFARELERIRPFMAPPGLS